MIAVGDERPRGTYLESIEKREAALGAAVGAAVMRRKEREVRGAFLTAGATSPVEPRSLTDIGLEENMTVRRLCRHAVIREPTPGLYYFDEEVWQSLRAMRVRWILLIAGMVVLLGVLVVYGIATLE